MPPQFSPAERAVHQPEDRRYHIGLKPGVWITVGLALLATFGAAWFQYLAFGLPADPSQALIAAEAAVSGFPLWLIFCHWINFFFLVVLIRSGLSILFDHPRLYFNNACKPGTEWLKLTPVDVPEGRLWTAKDDARYLSPLVGLPGYRHSVGLARGWHFVHVPFFVLNGAVFVTLLFCTDQWQRLVPTSLQIIPDAWSVFVHYATFNFPVEPNGFYHYNALQKLSYFSVVFVLAPLAILTGMCMSPAVENRFHWLPKLFVNRQGARSVHFLVMLSYAAFLVVHVALVAVTGLVRNMNHITLGTDHPTDPAGLAIGVSILLFTALCMVGAHWISWNKPRWVQRAGAAVYGKMWELTINKLKPKSYFEEKDISPHFWANGKLPSSESWKQLAEDGFRQYKLKISGLVENPVELSLAELKDLGMERQITMHHCIQGWSGVAQWGGVPIQQIAELVRPRPSVGTVVFYSFGEGLYGGKYYDTHTLDNCLKPGSILAWEMNGKPLPELYGAPLRLRVENQLGYKMVKWIERIEFVPTHEDVGKGYGGKNEDDEYYDLIANS